MSHVSAGWKRLPAVLSHESHVVPAHASNDMLFYQFFCSSSALNNFYTPRVTGNYLKVGFNNNFQY